MYLIAPAVFLILYYCPKYDIIWTLIFIIIGIFINIAPKLFWNIPHYFDYMPINSIWNYVNSFNVYYWRTESHLISYFLGIFCGHLIRRKPDLYLGGRIGETILWIVCPVISFMTMYWIHKLYDYEYPMTSLEMLMFLAFSKISFLVAWLWLFYACATGRGGII